MIAVIRPQTLATIKVLLCLKRVDSKLIAKKNTYISALTAYIISFTEASSKYFFLYHIIHLYAKYTCQ
ncbi:MAG: hypothetical protein ACLRVU_05765 [Beduini sp.]